MIRIHDTAFDPWDEIRDFQATMGKDGQYGACATFVGTMRDMNEGDRVQEMLLEHYPGMTEKHLEEIVDAALARWDIMEALIVHRTGRVVPNDPIVLVAVWSAHRKEAFEACRWMMEDLKSKAPFWKKEILENKNRWVEKNTSGF